MEKFQISYTITNNFINWAIWNLFISYWVVNLWEQYHFYFFTYAYHNITYTQFFIHQSQLFININICFEINAINFFLVKQCDKFYEFCFFSDLDTLNLKLDVMLFFQRTGWSCPLFRKPLPFCLSLAANSSLHTHTLSLSPQIGTHQQCSAIQSTWVLIFLSVYFYFSNFSLGLNTFTPICLV